MRKVCRVVLAGALSLSFVVAGCAGINTMEAQADTTSVAGTSASPSVSPSVSPTAKPSAAPSVSPTVKPSASPSVTPTAPANTVPATPVISKAQMVGETVQVLVQQQQCSGVEVQVINKSTKKVVKSTESNTVLTTLTGVPRKAVYYVQVQAYSYDSSYQKVYSDWSEKTYLVAQPSISKNKKNIKKTSIKCKWNKVNAQSYTVYLRKRGTSKWTKAATTKKTSYVLKKLKGKKINTRKNNYEMKVTATAKVNGKKITSDDSAYVYTYTYVTY